MSVNVSDLPYWVHTKEDRAKWLDAARDHEAPLVVRQWAVHEIERLGVELAASNKVLRENSNRAFAMECKVKKLERKIKRLKKCR